MCLKDLVNTLLPLHLGPGDLDTNPKPQNPLTCKFKPDRSGHVPNSDKSIATGSCRYSSAPTVIAVVQQAALQPQNLNIPFKTMEWNGPVAGRLSRFIENWKLITADPWVLRTIQGHQIEFLQQPELHYLPICENGTLQNGRTAPTQHHGQTRRLVHKGGPIGRILPCTNQSTQTIGNF